MHSKESTQLLGVILDSRLNWDEHFNRVRTEAKKALNTIRVVVGKKWGRNKKNLKKLFSIMYSSKMDHGC